MSDVVLSVSEWIVWDPLDGDALTFATEAEAVKEAECLIETYLDDGFWAEEVTEIYVAQRTHTVRRVVEADRSEMGDEAFEELTGDCNGNDEWWSHHLERIAVTIVDEVEP